MHPFITSYLKIQQLQAEDINRYAIVVEQYYLRELVASCFVPEFWVGFYCNTGRRYFHVLLWDNTFGNLTAKQAYELKLW